MKKNRSWILSLVSVMAAAAALTIVIPLFLSSPAEAQTGKKLPQFVTLSVDMKLLDVSWRCAADRCIPWYLTKAMEQGDVSRMFTLNGGDTELVVSETRSGTAWPKAATSTIMTLPVDQRLLGVNWVCRPAGCSLSLLTRTMYAREEARGYVFTDGESEYFIMETREASR